MLEKINSPHDLKKLSLDELVQLAAEVRAYIISTVSKKAGHLASSLGAVEICLALQYCLDTPNDTIVYDVGHQTYAHKIVTGRRDQFVNLRQQKGISGFPNFHESIYDAYISGHASTAVSWASGIAEAKRLTSDPSRTVAVIGDGSLTGGMCFEALNHCGHINANVLIILNHNEMSISSSVGSLSNYLTKIISLPIYNRIKNELESFLHHLPQFAQKLAHKVQHMEEAIKGLIVPGIVFEEFGFRYFGPLDGHNLGAFIPSLKNIVSLSGPRVLHVITTKGKGYAYAEDNPERFHSASTFSIATGRSSVKKKEAFTDVFAQTLTHLARTDTRIVAITAAMTKGTGLTVFEKEHRSRFFDVGIAEEHAVGLASGLAKKGMRPFVAIYSTFLQRAFDQIIHDVALQNIPVVFCIDRAGLVGEDGPTHHGVFDISYLRMIPDMVCMAAKDKEELEDMITFSLTVHSPVSIRYPKDEGYSLNLRKNIELGKAQVIKEGNDICIIALGSMVKEAIDAGALLEERGIDACIINARFIKPFDERLFFSLTKKFKIVFTVEEGVLAGGFGSALLEFYEQKGCLDRIKVSRFGIPDEFSTFAKRQELFKMYGLDSVSLAKRIEHVLKQEFSWHT